mmetsp:Transcript_40328/g.114080  ORF Transcript_40328/g.114080 Transcript_40328/m.114080 type:complete len:302 (-) Transcript_40328:1191-2096(-)
MSGSRPASQLLSPRSGLGAGGRRGSRLLLRLGGRRGRGDLQRKGEGQQRRRASLLAEARLVGRLELPEGLAGLEHLEARGAVHRHGEDVRDAQALVRVHAELLQQLGRRELPEAGRVQRHGDLSLDAGELVDVLYCPLHLGVLLGVLRDLGHQPQPVHDEGRVGLLLVSQVQTQGTGEGSGVLYVRIRGRLPLLLVLIAIQELSQGLDGVGHNDEAVRGVEAQLAQVRPNVLGELVPLQLLAADVVEGGLDALECAEALHSAADPPEVHLLAVRHHEGDHVLDPFHEAQRRLAVRAPLLHA